MKTLDPRFHPIAAVIDDPDERTEMRDTARRHAEAIAAQCGFGFQEALDQARAARQPEPDDDDLSSGASVHDVESVEIGCTDASDPAPDDLPSSEDGQIAATLKADPSRSDRDIGREHAVSPTTVGKIRRTLGFTGQTRSVVRGGQTYDMSTWGAS